MSAESRYLPHSEVPIWTILGENRVMHRVSLVYWGWAATLCRCFPLDGGPPHKFVYLIHTRLPKTSVVSHVWEILTDVSSDNVLPSWGKRLLLLHTSSEEIIPELQIGDAEELRIQPLC